MKSGAEDETLIAPHGALKQLFRQRHDRTRSGFDDRQVGAGSRQVVFGEKLCSDDFGAVKICIIVALCQLLAGGQCGARHLPTAADVSR